MGGSQEYPVTQSFFLHLFITGKTRMKLSVAFRVMFLIIPMIGILNLTSGSPFSPSDSKKSKDGLILKALQSNADDDLDNNKELDKRMGYEIVIEEEFEIDDDDEEDVQKRGALRPMNRADCTKTYGRRKRVVSVTKRRARCTGRLSPVVCVRELRTVEEPSTVEKRTNCICKSVRCRIKAKPWPRGR